MYVICLCRGGGTHVVAISRTQNQGLIEEATKNLSGSKLDWIISDLTQTEALESLVDQVFLHKKLDEYQSFYLINNAGVVQPIAPVERCSAVDITRNVQLNLIAPMVLTSDFIKHTALFEGDKAVLNISSGAGRNPSESWSSYCSAKAGLDMFTRCVGLEQSNQSSPVRVLSIAPGVVDTPMQQVIRDTDPEDFTNLERFIVLKESGQLATPDEAAAKLLRAMFDLSLPTGSILDVRKLND